MSSARRPLERAFLFIFILVFSAAAYAIEPPRLRVDDYFVNAALTPKMHRLKATARVTFTALDDINSTVFELHNALRVSSVTDGRGKQLRFERISQENAVRVTLPTTLPKNQSDSLTFTYDGVLSSADDSPVEGLKLAYVGEDESYLLYAGRWFPVSGYGTNRFTAKINIAIPAGYTVIGSGPTTAAALNQFSAEDGTANSATEETGKPLLRHGIPVKETAAQRRTLDRAQEKERARAAAQSNVRNFSEPGSSVFSFAWVKPSFPGDIIAGHFQTTASAPSGAAVHVYFAPNHKQFAAAYADTAAKELEFYSSFYGAAPSSQLNIVELPDDTVPSAWAPGIAAIASRAINEKVDYRLLAEVIAHQWWGASVSPATRDDDWLRDGAARYSEARYVEHAAGEAGYNEVLKDISVGALAYNNIPLASVGKLAPFSAEAQSLSRDKGAMIFSMLRWVMGDDRFDNTMRIFAMQFAGKSASSDDLRKIAEQHFGGRMEWFFAQWLDSTGAPEFKNKYTVYRLGNGKGFRVTGEISQDLDLFRMPVELKIDTDGKTEDKRIEVVGTNSPYSVETFGMPRKITIDPNDRVLKESPDLKVRVAILRGEELVQQGDLANALIELQKALQINSNSSLAHYRIAEVFFQQRNYQAAANAYREAINGDGQPAWTEVWSHVQLGKIFDTTDQRERAVNEYRQAVQTNDNTLGALDEARKYLGTPYQREKKQAALR